MKQTSGLQVRDSNQETQALNTESQEDTSLATTLYYHRVIRNRTLPPPNPRSMIRRNVSLTLWLAVQNRLKLTLFKDVTQLPDTSTGGYANRHFNINVVEKWHKLRLQRNAVNAEAIIQWDMLIQTDQKLQETWPGKHLDQSM